MLCLSAVEVKNVRTQIQDMLRHSRQLVDQRQQRRGRRQLYAPRIKWASWILGGGEQDEALPASGRKANRQGDTIDAISDEADDHSSDSKDSLPNPTSQTDTEKGTGSDRQNVCEHSDPITVSAKNADKVSTGEPVSKDTTLARRLRGTLADMVEWLQESDDFLYASKLTVAVVLVSWPAFIASWNNWFSLNRGGE